MDIDSSWMDIILQYNLILYDRYVDFDASLQLEGIVPVASDKSPMTVTAILAIIWRAHR